MPLPTQTLTAIQTAGAAVHAAESALKDAVQSYADQVKLAMLENPFDVGNDSLFADWKTVARLARVVGQVEAEFRKIYSAASDLSAGAIPAVTAMPSLVAPERDATIGLALVHEIDATDVAVKKLPKKAKIKTKARDKTKAKPIASTQQSLSGNSAKVLARLLELLNPDHFVKVNQSTAAADLGLPNGSIGASIAKLIQTGHIIKGAAGEFKLGTPSQK